MGYFFNSPAVFRNSPPALVAALTFPVFSLYTNPNKSLTSSGLPKMRATSAELEELSQSIATAEAEVANLTAQNSSSEAQVGKAKMFLEAFASGNSLPTLQTRIRSIYPNWGFVTLASGNNAGVVNNSSLDVVRDDQVICKLLVTAVESTSASASIVPDSMKDDITLMVGDLVVPGARATAEKAVKAGAN